MYRRIRTAAFAVAITVLLSGLGLAQPRDDKDDYNNHKDRKHESKRDHDRDHDRDRDRDHDRDRDRDHDRDRDRGRDDHRWRDRDDRDDHWRNPVAYGNGGWRRGDGDADDLGGYRGNHGYYGNYPYGNYPYGGGSRAGYGNSNVGYNQGYQDGSRVGQSDMAQRKQFDPYPRGAYRTSDHGYHSGYGDKGAYQQSYLGGYEAGYRSSYRGGYGRY